MQKNAPKMILQLKKLVLLMALSSAQHPPCPESCSCTMDTLSCPQLIDSCTQCRHWPKIEFNQVASLSPFSFKKFHFSPQSHYSIIIYKLLNSSLTTDTFNQLIVPQNSKIQITFQYNSYIKFNADCLNGLVLSENSTMVFNFPYTTQVMISLGCMKGVQFSNQSKLIFKIFKSFSVSFIQSQKLMLQNAQVLFNINSTQSVKFEPQSLHADLFNSSISFNLKSIEKCIMQKNFFINSNLTKSKVLFHLKQIFFLDINPISFKSLKLIGSALKIYLIELMSSFCVQPNSLSQISLEANSSLNFSLVQSKNVQFMSNSLKKIDSKHSRVFIGVLDSDLNDNDVNTLVSKEESNDHSFDFYNQFYYSKQKYTYNLSVAKDAFSVFSSDKLVILADNLDTVYFDDFFVSGSLQLVILINVKNLVVGEQSTAQGALLEFMSEPNLVKLHAGFIPKISGIQKLQLSSGENYNFVKQWENCIEESMDYVLNGELSNVLSHVYDYDTNSTSLVNKSSVKITGLFITGLVLLVLFFLLVVNLVQYKYRDDSFDDFESSTQNANAGENLIKCENDQAENKANQSVVKNECLVNSKAND